MTDEKFSLVKYLRLLGGAETDGTDEAEPYSADGAETDSVDDAAAQVGESVSLSPTPDASDALSRLADIAVRSAGAASRAAAPQPAEPTLLARLARRVRQMSERSGRFGASRGGSERSGALAERGSAPTAQDASYADERAGTPDRFGEAPPRTPAQAELPPAEVRNRTNAADGGNSAASPAAKPASALPRTAAAAETSYADDTRIAEALPPPETPQAQGDGAASDGTAMQPQQRRAPSPGALPPSDMPPSAEGAPREYASREPAALPQPEYGGFDTAVSAAKRPAIEQRPPRRAESLHTITRALTRELRRYG